LLLAQVTAMSLITGSLFSNQKDTASDARNFFGVSFLGILFLSMGAMPEMAITFSYKPCASLNTLPRNAMQQGCSPWWMASIWGC
jgi:hypothetical protein